MSLLPPLWGSCKTCDFSKSSQKAVHMCVWVYGCVFMCVFVWLLCETSTMSCQPRPTSTAVQRHMAAHDGTA